MTARQKLDKARGRLRRHGWAVVQQAAAAGLAWWLANLWDPSHHPFFAPIAAVVGLNTTVGGRGLQAVRLIFGVAVGIVVGSLALELFGTRAVALPVATLVAMGVAVLVGAARVTIAQAASTAVLTVWLCAAVMR